MDDIGPSLRGLSGLISEDFSALPGCDVFVPWGASPPFNHNFCESGEQPASRTRRKFPESMVVAARRPRTIDSPPRHRVHCGTFSLSGSPRQQQSAVRYSPPIRFLGSSPSTRF